MDYGIDEKKIPAEQVYKYAALLTALSPRGLLQPKKSLEIIRIVLLNKKHSSVRLIQEIPDFISTDTFYGLKDVKPKEVYVNNIDEKSVGEVEKEQHRKSVEKNAQMKALYDKENKITRTTGVWLIANFLSQSGTNLFAGKNKKPEPDKRNALLSLLSLVAVLTIGQPLAAWQLSRQTAFVIKKILNDKNSSNFAKVAKSLVALFEIPVNGIINFAGFALLMSAVTFNDAIVTPMVTIASKIISVFKQSAVDKSSPTSEYNFKQENKNVPREEIKQGKEITQMEKIKDDYFLLKNDNKEPNKSAVINDNKDDNLSQITHDDYPQNLSKETPGLQPKIEPRIEVTPKPGLPIVHTKVLKGKNVERMVNEVEERMKKLANQNPRLPTPEGQLKDFKSNNYNKSNNPK